MSTPNTPTTPQPLYRVRKAPGVPGKPIPADEPILVVRGQDALAIPHTMAYGDRYLATYGDKADPKVMESIQRLAFQMFLYQTEHPDRVKMADR
jgi:hypothetical protein